jgi:adenylate cyclase
MAEPPQGVEPLVVEKSFVARSSPDALWDVITDTEVLNRAAGLGRITVAPLDGESAARFLVRTKLGGFNVEYEEFPFEWVKPKRFSVRRRMRNGPVHELHMAYFLTALPEGGTGLRLQLTLHPRIGLMRPVLRLSAHGGLSDLEAQIRKTDDALARKATSRGASKTSSDAMPAPASETHPDERALSRATTELAKVVTPALAKRLAEVVRASTDFDLARLRAYELADRWKLSRKEVLEACLAGVRAGLLELRWELICPSCRTAAASMSSLAELEQHGNCQLCDLSFGLDLDESVELVFSPASSIRDIDRGPYCIGGPARTPHVLAQIVLPANGRVDLEAPGESGAARLFIRGGDVMRLDVAADAPTSLKLDAFPGAWPARAKIAPSGTIGIDNTGHPERHAKIEQTEGQRYGTPARDVTLLPAFRRDFSTDLLRRDLALKVSRVALLFTDLTGSTALYAREGDARAFRVVIDHFDVLREVIERCGGVIIKTIGDAIMATFSSELDAVRAAWAALHAFEKFRTADSARASTHLKLGVHAGPCYVVTANGILDYFGQTVNVAARLQGEAKSGEIVVTETLAKEAVAAGTFPAEAVSAPETPSLKGVDEAMSIVRIAVVTRSPAERRFKPIGPQ